MRGLFIKTSPKRDQSTSNQIGEALVKRLVAKDQSLEFQVRDLSQDEPPHMKLAVIGAAYTPPEARTAEHDRLLSQSDIYLKDFLEADVVVIATPMWNFGMPSALKAWIDHIVRVGRTFSFKDGKPVGLANAKKVYFVISSGSVYSSGPYAGRDSLTPHIQNVFGFIGIDDLVFVRAEGMNDPQAAATALTNALDTVKKF